MTDPKTNSLRTLDVRQSESEMVKPAELIEIQGAASLTLGDRRVFNLLLRNAFGPALAEEEREFEIPLSELRDNHEGNDRLIASVEALMKTVVTIRKPDGSTDRSQLLGPNNMADPSRPRGMFTYSFPSKLAVLLKDSTVFAKLETEVLRAFSSKYALALYESVARRVRLQHICTAEFSLEEFRDLLGVEAGKLKTFGNLNQYAIKPAVEEVNALAPFQVAVQPRKAGRRVVGAILGWNVKDIEGRKAAYQELQRPKIGRRARLNGSAEEVITESSLFDNPG